MIQTHNTVNQFVNQSESEQWYDIRASIWAISAGIRAANEWNHWVANHNKDN